MDRRYQVDAVSDAWTLKYQYRTWLDIGRIVASHQGDQGIIPQREARLIFSGTAPVDLSRFHLDQILEQEAITGHDVAAFLIWWRERCGPAGKYAGYGLTSSDFVETALGIRFRHLEPEMWRRGGTLDALLGLLAQRFREVPMLGRTHGQVAEPTTLGIRIAQWQGMVERTIDNLRVAWSNMRTAKLSGPVGTYAHNPPALERAVANDLELVVATDSSQVVARDSLAAWASAAAQVVGACSKIAVDYRLMAARGEVREGWPEGRVGSSSMPHKRNPVRAERISGMTRLAQGYASMLQPVDLWEDRDISHSSVERVAIPDLMHVLFYALDETADLLNRTTWDTETMLNGLLMADRLPYTAWATLWALDYGGAPSREQAEEWARHWADHPTDYPVPSRPIQNGLVRRHPLVSRSELTARQDSR